MAGRAIVPEFRPGKDGLRQILGDLEADIMEIAWARGQCTVRDVYEELLMSRERELAYTTVMTVMGRLADKALLSREAVANTYVYRPAQRRDEYLARVVGEVLDALFVSHREQTISHLASRLKNIGASELDALDAALAKLKGQR